jgi:hypothetical protein
MFNLEKSIAQWHRRMLAAGIKTPEPLGELESHLCEEIERQLGSGLDAERAFAAAVQLIGPANTLKQEFKKTERTLMKKIMIILLGVFGILFGPAIFLPALAKHRDLGVWNSDIVMPALAGIIILLVGIGTAIYGVRRRKV